jgi:hypothetical protein
MLITHSQLGIWKLIGDKTCKAIYDSWCRRSHVQFSLALFHSRPIHGPQSQWGFGYWAPIGPTIPTKPNKIVWLVGWFVPNPNLKLHWFTHLDHSTPSLRLFLSLSLSPIVVVRASRSSSCVQNYLCNMCQIAHRSVLLHLFSPLLILFFFTSISVSFLDKFCHLLR